MLELQRVQNAAVRFVTNTSKLDRVRSENLHKRLDLDPINLTIHRLAKRTWQKIEQLFPDTYNTLSETNPPIDQRLRWASSRRIAETQNPIPIYT